jgi:phage shock protein E
MFGLNFGRGSSSGGHDARARVAAGAALVDVRTPEEFAMGHVAGARNIPVQELGARYAEIPKGQVVLYCRSGARSASAAQFLSAKGYDVLDIGPMTAW